MTMTSNIKYSDVATEIFP